ncbi:heavy metal-binding protein HIP-like isoform X2 [Mercenaria mercenaria]|uniref:heavy metal-binding protein HIP-like isoform X2 n=1 Tax=Mercenaria mercenaria TaxID=6596 RepID=UPI00234ECD5F|nr:heavy metal-binding protein HIP-like isoform X2 [Mercenaria mercenaria]
MFILWLFVMFGLPINVCLLEELCGNRCGCDFSVMKKLMKLEQEVETLKEVTHIAKCKNVAFRAQLTQDLGSVTLGQKIVYDSVELNLGNAFHPFHGIFTAPCDGTYLFSITIGNSNKPGVVHLKKNNITIEYAWAGHNAGWDMGGVSTVARLNAGDDVWVEGRGIINGANSSDGIGVVKHTAFSGTLLHAL